MTEARHSAAAFLFFCLCAVVFLRQPLFLEASWFACCDASVQTFAWLGKISDAVRSGSLPLWDFSIQGGTSFAGELQPAPFYPVAWVLAATIPDPYTLANAFVATHYLIAALGMYLFMRRLGAVWAGAVAAGVIFAFAGHVALRPEGQPNIHASMVWLPLVALFYHRALTATDGWTALRDAGLAGLIGAVQISAGHLQPFIHTSYAMGFMALFLGWGRGWMGVARAVGLVVLGQSIAGAAAAVPVLLTVEYLERVMRWTRFGVTTFPHEMPLDDYLRAEALRWEEAALFFDPSHEVAEDGGTLYFTITGFILAVTALVLLRKRMVAYAVALALLAFLVALGGRAHPVGVLSYELPLLAQVRSPGRALYLIAFAGPILAGLGLTALAARAGRFGRAAAVLVPVLLLVPILGEAWVFSRLIGMPKTLNGQYAPTYHFQSVAVDALERLSNSGPLVDRFVADPGDLVPPNIGNLRPLLSLGGHRATMLEPLFEYRFRDSSPASPFHDRLGLRYLISAQPVEGLPVLVQGDGWVIQERPGSLSVFWLLDPASDSRTRAPVTAVDWGHNSVTVELAPGAAGTLVFAQPAYPGWHARVDGTDRPLVPVEIFNGVELGADAPDKPRRVEFVYRPDLTPGLLAMAGALGLVAVFSVRARRRRPA